MSAAVPAAELTVEALTIRFGGLTRRRRHELRGARRRGAVADRPQRRRQDHRLQRHHRLHRAGRPATSPIAARASTAARPARSPRWAWCAPSRRPASSPARPCSTTSLIGLHLRSRQQPLAILLGLPSVAREEKRAGGEARARSCSFVGLEARARPAVAASLPYGELRLLEVAVALAAKPKLLLLDEPVSGMNPLETASFMKMLAPDPRASASPCCWSSTT